MKINRPTPIVEQVNSILRQRIQKGVYGPNDRIPSESELSAEFGVSRATVRSALSALAAEKLIIRRQGDGTYVNKRFLDVTTRFGTIWEFTNLIKASGQIPTVKAISVVKRPATIEESTALDIPEGELVFYIKRLFLADGNPAIMSYNVIPKRHLCEELNPTLVAESLPKFFKKFCHEEFTYGIADLSATLPDPEVAEVLAIDSTTPVLQFVELFYSLNDQPLVYAVNFFNNKTLKLRVGRSID